MNEGWDLYTVWIALEHISCTSNHFNIGKEGYIPCPCGRRSGAKIVKVFAKSFYDATDMAIWHGHLDRTMSVIQMAKGKSTPRLWNSSPWAHWNREAYTEGEYVETSSYHNAGS